jgi:preprotein translocase subunit SecG
MQAVLIIVQLLVSIALVIVVLLQRSEGGALGMGGGGSGLGGLFSPRGAADTLTQTTIILGALFFISSIGLTLLSLHGSGRPTSILDSPAPASQSVPLAKKVVPAPSAPAVPKPQ